MRPHDRPYHCHVCGWQGRMEPLDAGDAALCPVCGIYLYPLTWGQTWGLAIVLILSAVVVVAFAARMWRWG